MYSLPITDYNNNICLIIYMAAIFRTKLKEL